MSRGVVKYHFRSTFVSGIRRGVVIVGFASVPVIRRSVVVVASSVIMTSAAGIGSQHPSVGGRSAAVDCEVFDVVVIRRVLVVRILFLVQEHPTGPPRRNLRWRHHRMSRGVVKYHFRSTFVSGIRRSMVVVGFAYRGVIVIGVIVLSGMVVTSPVIMPSSTGIGRQHPTVGGRSAAVHNEMSA